MGGEALKFRPIVFKVPKTKNVVALALSGKELAKLPYFDALPELEGLNGKCGTNIRLISPVTANELLLKENQGSWERAIWARHTPEENFYFPTDVLVAIVRGMGAALEREIVFDPARELYERSARKGIFRLAVPPEHVGKPSTALAIPELRAPEVLRDGNGYRIVARAERIIAIKDFPTFPGVHQLDNATTVPYGPDLVEKEIVLCREGPDVAALDRNLGSGYVGPLVRGVGFRSDRERREIYIGLDISCPGTVIVEINPADVERLNEMGMMVEPRK
jgi:hypothetical protein